MCRTPEARKFYLLALQNPEALESWFFFYKHTQQIRQLLFSPEFPVKVHSKCLTADVLIGLIHSLEALCHSQNIFLAIYLLEMSLNVLTQTYFEEPFQL